MDVKTLCLGVLSCGDASGYEIKKQFEEGPFAYIYDAAFGSIYPALGKLKDEGLVTFKAMAQDGRPDKKVYSINDNGLAALRKALNKKPQRDKMRSETLFMFFLAHLMDRQARQDAYDSYLETYKGHVAEMRGEQAGECSEMAEQFEGLPGHEFVHGFGLAVYQAAVDFLENNRHLLFPEEGEQKVAGMRN